MPTYRFLTDNGGSHYVDLDLPDDKSARAEGRKAFSEAAHDALADGERGELTFLVQQAERIIYRGHIAFQSHDIDPPTNDGPRET
ncbi:DUF6894 family protein [Bosea sp. NPDC055353]